MFAPENYWTWNDLHRAVAEWTKLVVVARIRDLSPDPFGDKEINKAMHFTEISMIEVGMATDFGEANFIVNLLEIWFTARFMDSYEPLICSPDGQLLQASPVIYHHADRMDWIYWDWPIQECTEFRTYFEQFRKGNFYANDIAARFHSIDTDTGTVAIKNNTVRLIHLGSHFTTDEDHARRVVKVGVEPFVGWAICYNPQSLPDTLAEFYEELGFSQTEIEKFGNADEPPSELVKTRDRNGLRHVFECVNESYPDGKGAQTWTEIETRVGYSRRHIVRALKNFGDYSVWAQGGQTPD